MQGPIDRRSILQALIAAIVSRRLASVGAGQAQLAVGAGRVGPLLPSAAVVFRENAQLDVQPFGDLHYYLQGVTPQLRNLIVGYLELKVGQTPHAPHTHTDEELMIFVEGCGEILLDGKVTTVCPGTVVYAGGGTQHGLVNTGKAPLKVYYLKWVGR